MALLHISLIRAFGEKHRFTRVEKREDNVLLRGGKVDFAAWSFVAADSAYRGRILINASAHPYISYKTKKGEDIPSSVIAVLKAYEAAKEKVKDEN